MNAAADSVADPPPLSPMNVRGTTDGLDSSVVRELALIEERVMDEAMIKVKKIAQAEKSGNSAVDAQTDGDGWEDILGSGVLQKKIIEHGNGRETRPREGCRVKIAVVGKLPDGTVIQLNPELVLTVGDGDYVKVFDLCVPLMELGEKCIVVTAARLAYGEIGRKPDVPANTALVYTIKLLGSEPLQYDQMTLCDRMVYAEMKRLRGNTWYKRGDYSSAINSYLRGIMILDLEKTPYNDESKDLLCEALELNTKLINNMGAGQLHVKFYDGAVSSFEKVLSVQPKNSKALFRLAKAKQGQGHFQEAYTTMQQAYRIEPTEEIRAGLLELKQKAKLSTSERAVYERMFGNIAKPSPKNKSNSATWHWLAYGAMIAAAVGIGAYRLFH